MPPPSSSNFAVSDSDMRDRARTPGQQSVGAVLPGRRREVRGGPQQAGGAAAQSETRALCVVTQPIQGCVFFFRPHLRASC